MKTYRRKTIPKYQAHAYALLALLAGIAFAGNRYQIHSREYNQPILSPQPAAILIVYQNQPEAQTQRIEDTAPIVKTPPRPLVDSRTPENIIAETFNQYGGEVVSQALTVARCESRLVNTCNDGLNADGSTDCGVFQININAHNVSRAAMLDIEKNIKMAEKIYRRNGWNDWYSSAHCWK